MYRNSWTLGLYLGRQFLVSVFLTAIVLLGILLIADGAGQLDRASGKALGADIVLSMVLLKAPDLILQLVPFIIMIGTMVCFARLTRNHELVAMRASGVSVWQFLLAPALVCIGIGLFNVGVVNPFAASMLKKYEHIYNTVYPGSAKGLLTEGGALWLRQPQGQGTLLIRAEKTQEQGRTLQDATLYHFNGQGGFTHMTTAQSMHLRSDTWVLDDVREFTPDGPSIHKDSLAIPTPLTPENLQGSFTSPNTLSVWELPQFIHVLRLSGFNTTAHQMQLHKVLVSPFLGLAMFILAAPFALRLTRMGGVGKLMVAGLMLGFGFYLLSNIIAAYGLSGRLPIMLSAWMPALIATMAGIALLLHFGEE